MNKKIFTTIGLMSGTSMDGVDISMIKSDGYNYIEQIYDKYYVFTDELCEALINLREKLRNPQDLKKNLVEINEIEKKFTFFNAKIVNEIIDKVKIKPDLIGFHGQTIFHQIKFKISKQIGDANLLSQLTKCIVVNKFRQQDIDNNGQGAPLTPLYHYQISKKICSEFNIDYPINIINIGGISNVTSILNNQSTEKDIHAYDIAPGNCLIDDWIRKNSKKKFDEDGKIAFSGNVDKLILNQAIDNFELHSIKESLDVKNFDSSFVKGLSIEDGCATLTQFTAHLIYEGLKKIDKINNSKVKNLIICGGGRKNKILIKKIHNLLNNNLLTISNIDKYDINGDFVESQAFAYLAIRSYLSLPISFPNTTRCSKISLGGMVSKNF